MSFDLVLFGGTGDLTWRKLMPALFQAWRHGKLPADGRILAVARDERSDEQYRAFIKDKFCEVDASKRPTDDEFARFAQLLHYRRMDLSLPADSSLPVTVVQSCPPPAPCLPDFVCRRAASGRQSRRVAAA